ncbi:uncharacterized protein LOC119737370 [Patiria miniata]|uniref:Apple domain-containing protein n=1 Tax=Patiria miniata TaxID=46514 RepID=A0A914AVT1_PATMI|nr:uncharacterized protein LOC119737370 [Patiria miniata]
MTRSSFPLGIGHDAVIAIRLFLLLVFMHLCHCISGELKALSLIGKNALQSSTYQGHSAYMANNAIDGDLTTFQSTDVVGNSHPWWIVDLGSEYTVARITVTNRHTPEVGGVFIVNTLARAGLHDDSEYELNQPCGVPVTTAESTPASVHEFWCDPPVTARYVSLDKIVTNTEHKLLNVAEVEVDTVDVMEQSTKVNGDFAECKPAWKTPATFTLLYEGGSIANGDPLTTKAARSPMHCALYCLIEADCVSFDYAASGGQCRLYGLNPAQIVIIPNDDVAIFLCGLHG